MCDPVPYLFLSSLYVNSFESCFFFHFNIPIFVSSRCLQRAHSPIHFYLLNIFTLDAGNKCVVSSGPSITFGLPSECTRCNQKTLSTVISSSHHGSVTMVPVLKRYICILLHTHEHY